MLLDAVEIERLSAGAQVHGTSRCRCTVAMERWRISSHRRRRRLVLPWSQRRCRDTARRRAKEQYQSLKIIDSIAWCRDLLPNLAISRKLRRVAVHPTCSTTDLGLAGALKQIAGRLAEEVEVPVGTTCCGTAGDRGLLHPELVVSATREVRLVLIDRPSDAYLSANRTCEMGLRHATGRPYESFIFLLEELSRPEAG